MIHHEDFYLCHRVIFGISIYDLIIVAMGGGLNIGISILIQCASRLIGQCTRLVITPNEIFMEIPRRWRGFVSICLPPGVYCRRVLASPMPLVEIHAWHRLMVQILVIVQPSILTSGGGPHSGRVSTPSLLY